MEVKSSPFSMNVFHILFRMLHLSQWTFPKHLLAMSPLWNRYWGERRHAHLILSRKHDFWQFSWDIRETLKKTMTRILGGCPAKAGLGRIGYF